MMISKRSEQRQKKVFDLCLPKISKISIPKRSINIDIDKNNAKNDEKNEDKSKDENEIKGMSYSQQIIPISIKPPIENKSKDEILIEFEAKNFNGMNDISKNKNTFVEDEYEDENDDEFIVCLTNGLNSGQQAFVNMDLSVHLSSSTIHKDKSNNILYEFNWNNNWKKENEKGFCLQKNNSYVLNFDIYIFVVDGNDKELKSDSKSQQYLELDVFRNIDQIISIDVNGKVSSQFTGPTLFNDFNTNSISRIDINCDQFDSQQSILYPIIKYFPCQEKSTHIGILSKENTSTLLYCTSKLIISKKI